MIYLDTSAAAKLVLPDLESDSLAMFLVERITSPLVSSAMLYPELIRAVNRHQPALADRAVALLQRVMTIPLTHDVLLGAATIGSPQVRTLDALHLASAVSVRSELEVLVTYGKRLADAATGLGLPVAAPASAEANVVTSPSLTSPASGWGAMGPAGFSFGGAIGAQHRHR